MEKRIGTAIIRIFDRQDVGILNSILSNHASLIIGRQGLPRTDGSSLISLVLEGSTDEIGSLTGQIGRLQGVQIKSVLLKNGE
jgi:putative iron-only hydrogenase system regulator